MQRRREGLRGKKRNRGERGEVRNWVWGSFDGLNQGRGRRKKLMKKAAKKGLRLRFAGSGERRLRQGLVAERVSGDLSFFATSLSLIFKGSDSLGLVSSEIERLLLQLREEEDDATSGLGATKQDPDGPDGPDGQQFDGNVVHQQTVSAEDVFKPLEDFDFPKFVAPLRALLNMLVRLEWKQKCRICFQNSYDIVYKSRSLDGGDVGWIG